MTCSDRFQTRWRPRGFSLITVLIWMVLLGVVSLLLHLRLMDQLETLPAAERQLYSLVLAQNGIELARSELPRLRIDDLLTGADGRHAGTTPRHWRNPLAWASARSAEPDRIRLSPDDGLLPRDGQPMDRAFPMAGGGYFWLRFSNNPEEPPDRDQDGVVLVRSLGLARSRLPSLTLDRVVHSTSLVEARLRQERVFELESALTLFSERGEFSWEGDSFRLWGGASATVSLIPERGNSLVADLATSLTPAQRTLIGGSDAPWLDQRDGWRTHVQKQRVFRRSFWQHFLEHLPQFADPIIDGLHYLPNGGVIERELRGVVIAQGSLTLAGQARLTGLLLHLGGGRLQLQDQAVVRGGVWMGSRQAAGLGPGPDPIRLRLSGAARVLYDPAAVQSALGRFPPTQLGWRLLFPESIQ